MTLRMVDKTILDSKYLVTATGGHYIIVDYLGDSKEFVDAIKELESLYDRKIRHITYNKFLGCLEIGCE